jgi:hypothetical protein
MQNTLAEQLIACVTSQLVLQLVLQLGVKKNTCGSGFILKKLGSVGRK